jgi:hypothetical protein
MQQEHDCNARRGQFEGRWSLLRTPPPGTCFALRPRVLRPRVPTSPDCAAPCRHELGHLASKAAEVYSGSRVCMQFGPDPAYTRVSAKAGLRSSPQVARVSGVSAGPGYTQLMIGSWVCPGPADTPGTRNLQAWTELGFCRDPTCTRVGQKKLCCCRRTLRAPRCCIVVCVACCVIDASARSRQAYGDRRTLELRAL